MVFWALSISEAPPPRGQPLGGRKEGWGAPNDLSLSLPPCEMGQERTGWEAPPSSRVPGHVRGRPGH